MTRDEATLLDLAHAARLAGDFAGRVQDVEALEDDSLTQAAVLHQLMVLGEATKRLSDSYRAAHPDLPWSEMARMRDRLIHGYDDVDLDVVWTTVTEDVPRLLD